MLFVVMGIPELYKWIKLGTDSNVHFFPLFAFLNALLHVLFVICAYVQAPVHVFVSLSV